MQSGGVGLCAPKLSLFLSPLPNAAVWREPPGSVIFPSLLSAPSWRGWRRKPGCRLVERKSRQRTPLELTRSGEIFLAYAQSAQTLEQQMREELSALHEQQTTLILGSGPTSSALLLPRLTQLFRRRFPHIPLVGKACPSSADVYDLLTQGGAASA